MQLRLARLAPFVEVDAVIAFLNHGDGPRHGNNNNRQLRRVSAILANFMRDFPDTPRELQHYAYRRAVGRAWKFARRNRNAKPWHPLFWHNLLANVYCPADVPAAIEKTLYIFE